MAASGHHLQHSFISNKTSNTFSATTLLDLLGTTSSGNSPFRTARSGFQQRDATQMKPREHIQLLDPSEVKNRPAAQRTRGCAPLQTTFDTFPNFNQCRAAEMTD
jgi:hypothetical protein